MELTERQREALQGLREFTDFLEANPEFIDMLGTKRFFVFGPKDKKEFATMALKLGNADKTVDKDWFNVDKKFGPSVALQLTVRRKDFCERVVVATHEVEVEERDAEAVEEALANIPMKTVTKTEEVIEWVCPPSLHDLAAQ